MSSQIKTKHPLLARFPGASGEVERKGRVRVIIRLESSLGIKWCPSKLALSLLLFLLLWLLMYSSVSSFQGKIFLQELWESSQEEDVPRSGCT